MIITLTQGKNAVVDDADWERVSKFKWYATDRGHTCYAQASMGGIGTRGKHRNQGKMKNVFLHRFIMNPKKGYQVDHKNGDGLDCRRSNLRIVTPAQNSWNTRPYKKSTSGFRGVVAWSKGPKPWKAQIQFQGKCVYLGYFDDPVDAAKAYNEASLKYHGEFGYRNLIPD